MTALAWDKVGDRRYETGVDHGVLYLPNGTAVAWNGLTAVSETRTREVKSYFIDGIKYLDYHVPGTYTAQLSAFTYPDELETLLGNPNWAPGVVIYDQHAKPFHLSYRTRVGNDLDGLDHGYKIHLVYNVLAVPGDVEMASLADNVEPTTFTWALTGVPNAMVGIRPTNHISVDSRTLAPAKLTLLEEMIYGSASGADAHLPAMIELLDTVGS
jgi:hypothetical protein